MLTRETRLFLDSCYCDGLVCVSVPLSALTSLLVHTGNLQSDCQGSDEVVDKSVFLGKLLRLQRRVQIKLCYVHAA